MRGAFRAPLSLARGREAAGEGGVLGGVVGEAGDHADDDGVGGLEVAEGELEGAPGVLRAVPRARVAT